MGFLEDLQSRKMLAQITHEEEFVDHISTSSRSAYAGFDPTADSLHVGHLLPVMALRRWQKAGHRVIALVGGGTALVGDPSGKTSMRPMLSSEEIDQRIDRLSKQLSRFLDFSSEDKGIVVNNADWLRPLEYLPFLREIGSHFSVNRMLGAECFKQRLSKGLSFLEFNYMILQSYDFYHLHKTYGCSTQLGGDDQWSNMLGGMELVRRKASEQAFCVTVPLLVNSAGKKMGKTENGAVWIDPDMTSPFDFYQYFRNVEDDMVANCMYYFTDLEPERIVEWTESKDININEAKIELAWQVTRLVHGEDEANEAKLSASKLFSAGGQMPVSAAPELFVDARAFGDEDSLGLADLLVQTEAFSTKSEIRRLVQQGGLSLDGEKVNDANMKVEASQLKEGLLLRKGKKHYYSLVLKA